jgi:hypothetical protein
MYKWWVTQFFHTKITYILYYQITFFDRSTITCAQWYMYKWIVECMCVWQNCVTITLLIINTTIRKETELFLFQLSYIFFCFILGWCFWFFGVYFTTTGLMVAPLSLPKLVCLDSRSTFVWSAVRLMELVLNSYGPSAFDSSSGVRV